MFTISRIKIAVVAGTAAVALIAAGCSNNDSSTSGTNHESTTGSSSSMPGMDHGGMSTQPAARTDFNAADITFLQMMYPHHAQAVEMAKLVPSRSQNEQLRTLAKNVEQAQTPEMQQITTLLQAFGKGAPSATMGHEGMAGMMSADQMSALEKLSGPEFDTQWMRMMIEHHKGAITMSNTELASGGNAEAKAMAQAIVTGQQTEIDEMNAMLGRS
ncbi:DUF305 domain-containing protein [Nocardia sp. SYP-A9097]|uniref:DUF305 domain-containing protein n=1 Tax=Nocardia sp. SYP-A9097 TaxID=2663237 RepID=UPI00129B1CB5|nr:DUF305 domain-containing protein [Nocardia sp. SYP-A9097]MRH86684.1 DUF305 domain-containing protein [Nocardia sp. SYP-A9097]